MSYNNETTMKEKKDHESERRGRTWERFERRTGKEGSDIF